MTCVHSIVATAYFRANARDVTPHGAAGQVQILYVPVAGDREITAHCAGLLSPAEQERAGRFADPADRTLFTQRRAFRRYCAALALGSRQPLSAFGFTETANGRPFLSNWPMLRFSFSSCRSGFLGAWSSTHDIGVDIEDKTRATAPAELARQFFSAEEARILGPTNTPGCREKFIRLWCLKEAALKSIGQGLPFGLDAFVFELDPRPAAVRSPSGFGGPGRYRASVAATPGHCIASVVRSRR